MSSASVPVSAAPLHSFHLAQVSATTSARALLRGPTPLTVPGLIHAECLTIMALGAPIVSPSRMQIRNLAMFAQWENEAALDTFLGTSGLGSHLSAGWHVRLEFLRRWGKVAAIHEAMADEPTIGREHNLDDPVVAVTLARLKQPQLPRFIKWGRPVETLVRDHPGTTLALAAVRLPRTVSTFSVWTSAHEMVNMVKGHSEIPEPQRHATAMIERSRKDFHFEFTTLRYRCLSESGTWAGRRSIVPN